MRRGIALVTIAALLGVTTPVAYANTASTSSTTTSSSTWNVKAGDTLWKISQGTGVSITQIEQANNLTNPNSLQVGQVLTIPSSGSGSTTSTSKAGTTYTIKSGDTLWSISQATGISVSNIEQANPNVNPNNLTVGSTLVMPSSTLTGTSTGTISGSTNGTTYTVKSGDTLWSISQAAGVSVSNIEQANPKANPNNLTVGMKLLIPSEAATTGTTTSGTTATGSTSTTDSVRSVVLTTAAADVYNGVSTQINTSIPVSVTAKDAQGNTITVPQSQISYAITGTNQVSNPANAKIDSSTQNFTATQPGSYACVATVDGVQSQPLDIDVIGPPSQLSVQVNPNLVSDSSTLVPVTFTVSDAVGQPPVSTTPITLTVDNPSIAGISLTNSGPITRLPSTVTTITGGDGQRTVWLRAGSAAGSANLVVTCGSLTKTIAIQSFSGPTKVITTVSSPTVVANTKFNDTITVQAYNADGSPAAGVPLSADYTLGLFKVLSNTVTTNSQGVGQFTVYENNTSTGMGSVGARTSHAGDDVPIRVVPGADATQSTMTLPSNFTLGQSYTVPVTVKDASGNPVLHLDQAAFDLHLQGTTGVYDAQGNVSELGNGEYQVTFFTPGNTNTSNVNNMRNGTYLASLLVNGVQVGSPLSVNVTSASYPAQVQPDSTPNISLTFPQKLIANSQYGSMYPMQIKVTDANGIPIANQQVALSSGNTNVAVPAITVVTTDANGLATAGITPGFMAGTATITAMSGTSTQTIAVQSVADPTSIALTAPTSVVASNGGSVTVTAKVVNADGSPASGIALDVFSVTSNSSGTMAPNRILTDANGVASFQVTPSDFTSGNTLNVQVTDNHDLSSNTLTFTLN